MTQEKKYEAAKILLEVSRVVSSSLNLEKVSELVLKESIKALGVDHASLFLVENDSKHLVLVKAEGFGEDKLDNIKLLGSWEVINEHLVKKKKLLVVNDVHKSAIFKDKKLPLSSEQFPIQSFMASPLEKEGNVIGVLIVSNRERPGHDFTSQDEELLAALSNNVAIALLNARLYENLKNLFLSTVTSLTRAIDAKDRYTSGHSERVMKYAVAIGKEMELDADTLENLRLASLLHDVGKIGVRESILMKPAKLLGYERRQMMLHPGIGARIVESIDNSHKIVRGILEHHERFDGTGYPDRLKRDAISLEGKVIAAADTFDALTTDRPYHKGYSIDEAFQHIKNGSGKHFDPRVVRAFITSFKNHHELWIK